MKVYSDPESFSGNNVTVTIGMFDGVHLGHAKLLQHLVQKAKENKGQSAVLSFWPHPRLVLNQEPESLQFITTLEEKTKIISRFGIDHLILIPFNKELASLTAERFIEDFLIDKIKMSHLVVGYNHRFGKDRLADFNVYTSLSKKLNFGISRVDAVYMEGKAISSTVIRQLLNEGKIEEARRMLGYDYSIYGTVTGGQRLGRRLGYPTANIRPNENYKLIPSSGVYACTIQVMGKKYGGMLNIGVRPTVDSNNELTIEAHILDFNQDIYSEEVEVTFIKKIREEKKFDGVDGLIEQLHSDEVNIRNILRSLAL
ncbi:bifunctional riboflavin kinase/FAD synthetase [Saccharicrinis fermentans]|uniref:Riboflavin biosynthesis protein n=1 Tax=Saccharicrinis fermentans DSM 9555 = JCM 21142 TaxID=869213 RepID=W7Y2U3_9BACT|nr:bifunctional riboflavin kinase/FAD synthetase [Saccharicrinis fermentans]GAF01898.1 riboflavin biosynthesis protein RibF [Saccharicrinis fermentans DSM 9555 = JCM 21142]